MSVVSFSNSARAYSIDLTDALGFTYDPSDRVLKVMYPTHQHTFECIRDETIDDIQRYFDSRNNLTSDNTIIIEYIIFDTKVMSTKCILDFRKLPKYTKRDVKLKKSAQIDDEPIGYYIIVRDKGCYDETRKMYFDNHLRFQSEADRNDVFDRIINAHKRYLDGQ